jgi:hypothetical protein
MDRSTGVSSFSSHSTLAVLPGKRTSRVTIGLRKSSRMPPEEPVGDGRGGVAMSQTTNITSTSCCPFKLARVKKLGGRSTVTMAEASVKIRP